MTRPPAPAAAQDGAHPDDSKLLAWTVVGVLRLREWVDPQGYREGGHVDFLRTVITAVATGRLPLGSIQACAFPPPPAPRRPSRTPPPRSLTPPPPR